MNFFIVNAAADMTLVGSLGVRGIPTFLFYRDGKVVNTLTGTHLVKEEIRSAVEALLAD